jgi:ribosomal protein L3
LKRINEQTNNFFLQGDAREDGYLFWGYIKTHILINGFFKENWLNPIAFQTKRNKNKIYLKNKRITEPKKYAKSAANWQKLNSDKVCAATSKRRSAKLKRTPDWLTAQQHLEIKEFYEMAKQLETIFKWKQHVDHIVPLQGQKVSGLHVPWNLQILSAKMNQKKSNRQENL